MYALDIGGQVRACKIQHPTQNQYNKILHNNKVHIDTENVHHVNISLVSWFRAYLLVTLCTWDSTIHTSECWSYLSIATDNQVKYYIIVIFHMISAEIYSFSSNCSSKYIDHENGHHLHITHPCWLWVIYL